MKKVYLSESANPILVEYLKIKGYEISFVFSTSHTYNPVNSHPDIYLCKMGFRKIFYGKPEMLNFNYPDNAIFNAVCMGKYFIHNLNITAPELLEAAKNSDKQLINVPQGYTKCNMAVLNDNAAITSDHGIAAALEKTGIDILLINSGHILLKGHPYGFIGGASGIVDNEIIFHGNLNAHPDYGRITDFLAKHNCQFKYFEEFELEDIGSIIEL